MNPLLQLSETQLAILDTAREFCAEEIAPFSAQWDRDAHFEPSLVRKLGELGFLGMMLPEAYDGLGLDTVTYLLALEEISAADASVGVLMSVHNSLPTQMILKYGSEAQKTEFLGPLARGEKLGAFALSEPDAGSDASSLRAQAVRDGDDWVINGEKRFITGMHAASHMMTFARTSGEEGKAKGITAFLVPTATTSIPRSPRAEMKDQLLTPPVYSTAFLPRKCRYGFRASLSFFSSDLMTFSTAAFKSFPSVF